MTSIHPYMFRQQSAIPKRVYKSKETNPKRQFKY